MYYSFRESVYTSGNSWGRTLGPLCGPLFAALCRPLLPQSSLCLPYSPSLWCYNPATCWFSGELDILCLSRSPLHLSPSALCPRWLSFTNCISPAPFPGFWLGSAKWVVLASDGRVGGEEVWVFIPPGKPSVSLWFGRGCCVPPPVS